MKNKTPPVIHVVAYISFSKINGILLSKISLITPPKQAVIVPKPIQVIEENPNVMPVCIPTKVKNPKPIESNNYNIL